MGQRKPDVRRRHRLWQQRLVPLILNISSVCHAIPPARSSDLPERGVGGGWRGEHGGTGGRRGAPRPRRGLGPAVPPGSGEPARRPESAMTGWADRQAPVRSWAARRWPPDQPHWVAVKCSCPARWPDGSSVGDWAAATSNGRSARPCTPGAGASASRDDDTTGTDPADPPDEQPAANTAPHPPRTRLGHIDPHRARAAPRLPGSCASPHTAGHARSDAHSGSCETVRPAQPPPCHDRSSEWPHSAAQQLTRWVMEGLRRAQLWR